MEKVYNCNLGGICRVAVTALSGMFAGGALYINTVQIPALRTVKDTPSLRQCWKETFLHAKIYQGRMAVMTIVMSAVGYYFDKSNNGYLLLLGALTMAGIFPVTKVMMPDIQRLLKDDVISVRDRLMGYSVRDNCKALACVILMGSSRTMSFEQYGETWVRTAVDKWNTRHFIRSLLGMTSFGINLYLIYTTK